MNLAFNHNIVSMSANAISSKVGIVSILAWEPLNEGTIVIVILELSQLTVYILLFLTQAAEFQCIPFQCHISPLNEFPHYCYASILQLLRLSHSVKGD